MRRAARVRHYDAELPFTIEILEFEDQRPVVIDRVIGGSVHFEEAKRIGHLFSLADAGRRPHGYRVLNHDHELVYLWQADDGDETRPE